MSEPTPEMVAFFERRTAEHIDRVRKCLYVLAAATDHAQALLERASVHDESKYSTEERVPYIWMTEFHRCRHRGEAFEYPEGMEAQVRAAIDHHMANNRHHPDFHADPNDMTEVDLIEMVCDWTAMSMEFDECDGSARSWADKTIGTRVHFNEKNRDFVYRMIELLDSKLDEAAKML